MRKSIGFLAIMALFTLGAEAKADFLPGFSGWTSMSLPSPAGGSDGLVNFTVYRNIGGTGNWVTDLGLPATPLLFSGPIDATARFVYFYQVVNTDPVQAPADLPGLNNLNSFAVRNILGPTGNVFTSGGFLAGTVFSDGAPVGPAGNRAIGPEPLLDPPGGPGQPDDVVDGVPSFSGFVPGFTGPFAGTDPAFVFLENGAGFAEFNFGTGIPLGGFSHVIFLTSNDIPVYMEGRMDDPGAVAGPSNGDIPAPNPEPASMSLMGLGLAGLLGYGWRKRKQVA